MNRTIGIGWLLSAGVALVLCLFLGSLALGEAEVDLVASFTALFSGQQTMGSLVIGEIRLPRACLAVLVGGSLGLAGAALQGLLRNPLAEPGVIGISGTAALGAVIAFYSGLSATYPLALPLGGMVGALASVIAIYIIAGRETSLLTLILAGVAINSLAGALTALALNLSPNPFAIYEIYFWLMGSLADRGFQHVLLVCVPIGLGWLLLVSTARALDALSLGEDTAQSLGVRLGSVRLRVIAGAALCVGASVSVCGVVGFVGLVVPHVLRPLVGYQPSLLLPTSVLGGAALTLGADIFVRTVDTGVELKLGVLTALIGAPFFFHLIFVTRRRIR